MFTLIIIICARNVVDDDEMMRTMRMMLRRMHFTTYLIIIIRMEWWNSKMTWWKWMNIIFSNASNEWNESNAQRQRCKEHEMERHLAKRLQVQVLSLIAIMIQHCSCFGRLLQTIWISYVFSLMLPCTPILLHIYQLD